MRAQFKEFLKAKSEYLQNIINQLSNDGYDFEQIENLGKESQKILLTAEMFGFESINNVAKLTIETIKNRNELSNEEITKKLLSSLKVFQLELSLLREL